MGEISRGRYVRRTGAHAPATSCAATPAAVAAPSRRLTAGEIAWLAALPTAIVAVLAILLIGPPLGRLLLSPDTHARFWSVDRPEVRPEPVEQGRFLIALTVPLLLTLLTAVGVRRTLRVPEAAARRLVLAIQLAALAFVALCLLVQRRVFGPLYPPRVVGIHVLDVFTFPTLLTAAAATPVLVAAARSVRVNAAWTRWTRARRGHAMAAGAVAIAAIAVWLLHAYNTEGTIAAANTEVHFNIQFTLDETFAVLDGRSPLVNYAAQYGSLWPYAFAAGMSLLGSSIGVWVALALSATGLGMLAIYAVLRRAADSPIGGLLLFLPVLATSFLMVEGTLQNRYTFANYFGTFPMRYAGPCMLAWVVARHLAGERPRRSWPIFLAAGIVVLNNADVGIAALGATFAALLWGEKPMDRARLARLSLEAAGGLAAAFALVSALTLARADAFPHVGLLLRFSRLFSSTGIGMRAMPTLGLHVVIYLTYVAAIGVATVRAVRSEPDRLLTGMLAWAGVFGLGAGAYFAGRSTPDDLPAMFLPWSLTLALLLIPTLAGLRETSWRRPSPAALACVFGFLAALCSLAQTPAPWGQIERLQHTIGPVFAAPIGQTFVAQHTRRGEPVAILNLLSHRIGANLGVSNVSPYSNSIVMPTAEQLDETISALRKAGGSKLFLDLNITPDDQQKAVEAAGFTFIAEEAGGATALWIDRRPHAPSRSKSP